MLDYGSYTGLDGGLSRINGLDSSVETSAPSFASNRAWWRLDGILIGHARAGASPARQHQQSWIMHSRFEANRKFERSSLPAMIHRVVLPNALGWHTTWRSNCTAIQSAVTCVSVV